MKAPARKNAAPDLFAAILQSACNKVLDSVSYPLTILERRQDFPGCPRLAAQDEAPFYAYTKQEMKKLFKDSATQIKRTPRNAVDLFPSQVFSFGGSVVEQAKKVVDAAAAAGSTYEGPDEDQMRAIVDKGIEGLVDTLSDFGLYAWCPYLRVVLKKRPQVGLTSPRIDLTGVSVEITATGELWSKYPWWNCYKWCTKWEKVIKCDKIASLTVTVDIKAEAHANVEADGPRVQVRGEFDKLRLDYPILDKIPLEGIANRALRDKLIYVYDASQLIATVPVLQSRFTVDSIMLPPSPDGIGVGIAIRQV